MIKPGRSWFVIGLAAVMMILPFSQDVEAGPEAIGIRQLQTMLFRVGDDIVVYRGLAGDTQAHNKTSTNLGLTEELLNTEPFAGNKALQDQWLQFRGFVTQELGADDAVVGMGWDFVVSLTETMRETNRQLESLLDEPTSEQSASEQLMQDAVLLQYMIVRYSARAYLMPLRADSSSGGYEKDLDVLANTLTESFAKAAVDAPESVKKKLKRINQLWRFIEPRFVQYNTEPAPLIVRRVGTKLVDELQAVAVLLAS